MIRLYTQHDLVAGAALTLDDGQSRYLAAVMRLAVGDEVAVFNGRDGEWRTTLASVGKRTVVLTALSQTRPQTVGPDVELIVALVKRGPLETIVEKATELGVRAIHLVTTERTNADHVRLDRLRAIAVEAAEQTGRLGVPGVAGPVKLMPLLACWKQDRQLMFCDEAGDARPILEALSPPLTGSLATRPPSLREPPPGGGDGEGVGAGGAGSKSCAHTPTPGPSPEWGGGAWAVLIGPEGGFSSGERDHIRSLQCTVPVSLGPRILRADTAAISALTLWQATLGDWQSPP